MIRAAMRLSRQGNGEMLATSEKSLRLSKTILDRLKIPDDKHEQFCRSIQAVIAITVRQRGHSHLKASDIAGPIERIADLSSRIVRGLAAAEGDEKLGPGVIDCLEHELRFSAGRPQYLGWLPNIDQS
jgi:hypothetical protein